MNCGIRFLRFAFMKGYCLCHGINLIVSAIVKKRVTGWFSPSLNYLRLSVLDSGI